MSFVVSLAWLKRGVAKTPTKLRIDKEELEKILRSSKNKEINEDTESDREEAEEEEITKDSDDVISKYKLEDYDEEEDDVKIKSDDIGALTCFASNMDDDLLKIKDEGEDSDEEDFEIKPMDNLLICGQADKEVCTLNAYSKRIIGYLAAYLNHPFSKLILKVYNQFDPCFYIHHDIVLPSYPLCVEWLDYDSTNDKTNEPVNFLAIGTLNPWIEIWDLDIVDTLEPDFILAPEKIKKKSKKVADKTICKINGHKDAVLDLSWNKLNRNILASGSADETIVLWDLETLKQATKIKHHKDKVQVVKFHPIEAFSLISGSFDQTVALFDCRNPTENFKTWNFETGDVEKVIWNHHSPNYFLASTEKGFVYMVDIRQEKALISMQTHEESVSVLALSSHVPGLLVTGSSDEIVKIWDIKDNELDLVFQKNLNIGGLNCGQASPDSDFVFAFGGESSNEPVVWDIRESKNVRDRFYPRMNIEFTQEDLKEENSSDNEDEKKKYKRKKIFADSKINKKKPKKAQKKGKNFKKDKKFQKK